MKIILILIILTIISLVNGNCVIVSNTYDTYYKKTVKYECKSEEYNIEIKSVYYMYTLIVIPIEISGQYKNENKTKNIKTTITYDCILEDKIIENCEIEKYDEFMLRSETQTGEEIFIKKTKENKVKIIEMEKSEKINVTFDIVPSSLEKECEILRKGNNFELNGDFIKLSIGIYWEKDEKGECKKTIMKWNNILKIERVLCNGINYCGIYNVCYGRCDKKYQYKLYHGFYKYKNETEKLYIFRIDVEKKELRIKIE